MILGGGIAGLYAAHQLLKHNPDQKLIIVEQKNRLGGRIHTYIDKNMTVEIGASRFSSKHTLLLKLLDEFHLSKKIEPIESSFEVAEPSPYNLKFVLGKIIAFSKIDLIHDLTKLSFLNYAKLVVSKEEVQYIEDSFGYYTELVVMNAKNSIELLLQLNDEFYSLKGGLTQLIDRLEDRLRLYPNLEIHYEEEVVSIQPINNQLIKTNNHYIIKTNKTTYTTPFCICTLPSNALKKIDFFRQIDSFLNQITTSPLCRIYCNFDTKWFKHLPKMTTKSPLRMIIPYSKNTVVFYSDNKYANYWQDIYEKHGVHGVNKAIKYYVKEVLNIDIKPIHTKVFYWPHGVGYWTIQSDKEFTSTFLQHPFPHFYMCGEHYSASFHQWMEGALETSQQVVDKLINDFYK